MPRTGVSRLRFVYGTLKDGFTNNKWMKAIDASFVCKAITVETHMMLVNRHGSPCLLHRSIRNMDQGLTGVSKIPGEVWSVSEEGDRVLDVFENEGLTRERLPILVEPLTDWKETIECEAYFLDRVFTTRAAEHLSKLPHHVMFSREMDAEYEMRLNSSRTFDFGFFPEYPILL